MVDTESFFSLLKAHRKSKNIEIDEIAEFTKINPKYLHAIESGDFKILPNVYMRLFLRSYAEYIDVDSHETLKNYEIYTTGKAEDNSKTLESERFKPKDEIKNSNLKFLENSPIPPQRIVRAVIVLIGIFLFFKLVSTLSQKQIPQNDKSGITTIQDAKINDLISIVEKDKPIALDKDSILKLKTNKSLDKKKI